MHSASEMRTWITPLARPTALDSMVSTTYMAAAIAAKMCIDGGIKPRDVDGALVKEKMKELGVDLTRQAPGYKTLQE